MKLFVLLLLLFTMLSMSLVNAGLTPEEQTKLMNAINKDRVEIGKKVNIEMQTLKYDPKLEKEVDSSPVDRCNILKLVPLKWNDVAENELKNDNIPGHKMATQFFDPSLTSIGCSKTYKCSDKGPHSNREPFEVYGACTVSASGKGTETEKLKEIMKQDMPHATKYANIIGVDGPNRGDSGNSSGNVFNLLLSLFLVFYA